MRVQVSWDTARLLARGKLCLASAAGTEGSERPQKLRKLRALLGNLPADEAAVFQDDVKINTNPEIGGMWIQRGQQAEVVTPGTYTKRYTAA
jgi:hypothetical protein